MPRRRHVRSFVLSLVLVAASVSAGQAAPRATSRLLYDEALVAVRVPGFAGIWMQPDGSLVVSLTRPSAAAARAARDDLARLLARPDLLSRTVTAHRARFSFRQLRAWHDAAAGDVFAVRHVVSTDVDERANVLRFGLADLNAAPVLRNVLARHGVPAAAVAVERARPSVQTSLDGVVRPLVGGVQINGGVGNCSIGFPAMREGIKGFVTASHCSRAQGTLDGTTYFQPSVTSRTAPVAVEVADPPFFAGGDCPVNPTGPTFLCRYSDASFNAILDAANYEQGAIARPSSGTTWNGTHRFRVTGETTPILGETVTKVGKTTGLTSGPVTATCGSKTVLVDFPARLTMPWIMLCQTGATYDNNPGDSGGPVFVVTSGDDVALAGIHWDGTSKFSPIANIERTSELGPLETCDPSVTC